MPWSGYALFIMKERRAGRASRRHRRRTRALALRALARHDGDRGAAIAEMTERRKSGALAYESRIRHLQAEEMLQAGLSAGSQPKHGHGGGA